MRILFLTENFPPEVNAAATRVYERALYWVRAGHSVTILTCYPNFPQGRLHPGWRQRLWSVEELDGLKVIRLPTFMARNEGFALRILDFVSFMVVATLAAPFAGRTDVVVATSPQFFAAVAGWFASVLRAKPFVFELSDLWPASIRALSVMKASRALDLMERVELFLYRRAAAVVALTPSFKVDLVRRGIPAGKIHVVINGVDLPRYAPRPKDAPLESELGLAGQLVIGYIGTHGLAQDLENVIDAAGRLAQRTDITFLFIGDGAAKPALVAAAGARGLRNVRFVDPQPKERMPVCWSVCDVALVHLKNDPVFGEVIPSKIFEAMAMGLPILLVAPPGEATRLIRDNDAGLAVNAGDPALLAAAVEELAADPALRARAARHSAAAAPRYSRQRQAEDMAAVLADVVARDRA